MSIAVFFNPNARSNKKDPTIEQRLRDAIQGHGTLYATTSLDAIEDALRTAYRNDEHTIVIAGGDGSVHWVVNEAIRVWGFAKVQQELTFVATCNGSINFMAIACNIPDNAETLLKRLVAQKNRGKRWTTRTITTLQFEGQQHTENGPVPFVRYAWATAIAGYGANLFPPLYREKHSPIEWRMIKCLSQAMTIGFANELSPAFLRKRWPQWMDTVADVYLRPFRGKVYVDGEAFQDGAGNVLTSLNVVHAGSVPLNLGNLLQAFGKSDEHHVHVHIGDVRARYAPGALIQSALGRTINRPGMYDGPVQSMRLVPTAGHRFSPVLDGEIYDNMGEINVTPAGHLRFLCYR